MSGPAEVPPRPLPLADSQRDLPMAISLERRRPEVGQAALALARRAPHLSCHNFLPYVGENREWKVGRHRLDADKAVKLAIDKFQPSLAGIAGAGLALPPYLTRPQVTALTQLAKKARLPLLGTSSSALALVRIAHAQRPWDGLALVVDVDDHALTWSAVVVNQVTRLARAVIIHAVPSLNLRNWKDRLLDGIADRCIRQSRRDPRETGETEQGLYDQIDGAMDAFRQGSTVELVIQAGRWFQNLFVPPPDLAAMCHSLTRQAVAGLRPLLSASHADGPPEVVLATAAVAKLPGLVASLQEALGKRTRVVPLPADALAQSAHEMAERWMEDTLPAGHLDVTVPLLRVGQHDTGSKTGKRPVAKGRRA